MEYINLFIPLIIIILSLFFPYNISYIFIGKIFLLTFVILCLFLLYKSIHGISFNICKIILMFYLYILFKYSILYSVIIGLGIYVYKLIHKKIIKTKFTNIFYKIIELIYLTLWILLPFYITYLISREKIEYTHQFILFFICILLAICLAILYPHLKLEKSENILSAIGYIFLFIPILLLCCLLLIFLINTFIFDYFINKEMKYLIFQEN